MQRASSAPGLAPLQLDASRAGSIADQVFRTLRASIITLRLTPATALSEQDIADRLKVSRQPVREAFIKLSEIGLVRVLPQRGTFVTRISEKEVLDARFVREAVECAIARRASAGIAKAAVEELRDIIGEQRKTVRTKDEEGFFVLDDAFHRSLAAAADCAYAWKVVEEAKGQMDRGRAGRRCRARHAAAPARDLQIAAAACAGASGDVRGGGRAAAAGTGEVAKGGEIGCHELSARANLTRSPSRRSPAGSPATRGPASPACRCGRCRGD